MNQLTVNEQILKLQFAKLLLKMPSEPFKAALALFPETQDDENTAKALKIATQWPTDPEVVSVQHSMVDKSEYGELGFLPSKADLCLDLWDEMQQCKVTFDRDNYVKIAKLYAESRGFIEKPQQTVNIDNSKKTINLNTEEEKKEAFEMVVQAHKEFEDYD